jgi:hypothetical protein
MLGGEFCSIRGAMVLSTDLFDSHVNKMCIAANVPLVESGTAGYFGQVQPIVKVCGYASPQTLFNLYASRIKPNALIAYPNPLRRVSLSVQSDQHRLNPSIV